MGVVFRGYWLFSLAQRGDQNAEVSIKGGSAPQAKGRGYQYFSQYVCLIFSLENSSMSLRGPYIVVLR